MTRRIVATLIAILLAGLGTAGVLWYALSADARATSRIANPVTVAIATVRIPAGTSGERIRDDHMIRLVTMPKDSLPEDYLSGITTDQEELVVTSNIAVGQILLGANFGKKTTVTSGLNLPDGKMAVTVETGVPEQVAGYVQTGSQITIFITYDVVDSKGSKTGFQRTRVLLPKVEVLAMGKYTKNSEGTTKSTSTSSGGSVLVTVAVTQAEAERLIEGLHSGDLYLGLLTDSVTVRPGSGVDNSDTAGGSTPLFP